MKKRILIYGLCGGVLIVVLKLVEYRFLVIDHSIEIYGGLIGLIFAVLGIWLGPKLTKRKETVIVKEVRATILYFERGSARIPNSVVHLTPAAADLLENQQRVTIKAALIGEDFSHPITVKIKLVDKVYA